MSKKADSANPENTCPVEELAEKYNVPAWLLAGLKTANNWGRGKELTETDFLKARDKWLRGPAKAKPTKRGVK